MLTVQFDVYRCMNLQATKRRLACREVAQLVYCAVDDLTGTRPSGFDDPSPENAYPRSPLLAQQRATMALRMMGLPLGTMKLVLGMVTAPTAILHPQGTMAAALGIGEVVLGVVMV
jgi:hypothetical protein